MMSTKVGEVLFQVFQVSSGGGFNYYSVVFSPPKKIEPNMFQFFWGGKQCPVSMFAAVSRWHLCPPKQTELPTR